MRIFYLLALLLIAARLDAATFTAFSSLDVPDDNPGNGSCNPVFLPPSQCTLRAAIMEANALPGGPHVVRLLPGRTYTLTRSGSDDTGLSGDLDILANMQIVCFGCNPDGSDRPIVRASAGQDRIFDIHASTVTLQNIVISGGVTGGDGGGVLIRNGDGIIQLLDLVLDNNVALRGGGIANFRHGTRVERSEIRNNISFSLDGMGIFTARNLTLRESAVYNNLTEGNGIAVMVETVGPGPAGLRLENSTISGHQGTGLVAKAAESVLIRNSTIARNSIRGVVVLTNDPSTLAWYNSIVARNGTDCNVKPSDIFATGFNTFGDNTCPINTNFFDQRNVDPLLTPLNYRGPGTTPVHWPRKGSPALNTGSNVGGAEACLPFDQTGQPRPQGFNGVVRCDRGAAEVTEDAIFFDSLETI